MKVDFPAWAQARAPIGYMMRLYVDEAGETGDVEIISSQGAATSSEVSERLTKFTLETVKRFRFERLVQDGEPRPYTTVVTVVYRST
ncbi:MAG: hypothetical protein KF833_07920 [Verrucomicrobiae bacterium]|nr:hypothetical protein [Verrucomicrobiae bacterium]